MAKEKGFDVTKHELVPEHEVLTEEEAEEVLDEHEIEATQLPKLKSKDPVAKEIGAETGDIVRVKRDSPTAGEKEAYRYVI